MKHFFRVMPGLLALLVGGVVLLTLFAWASLQDPRLEGAAYYQAALGKLFGPWTTWTTLAGVGIIVLGLAHLLWSTFLAGADGHERREAVPVFWMGLCVGTVAMVGLLLGVNYFGLQAGEITPISRWLWPNR